MHSRFTSPKLKLINAVYTYGVLLSTFSKFFQNPSLRCSTKINGFQNFVFVSELYCLRNKNFPKTKMKINK